MMPSLLRRFFFTLTLLPAIAWAGPASWQPVNGTVPAAGFTVDGSNRLESLAFYNAVYLASEGATARMGWTGNFSLTCSPGSTSDAFKEDIRRRINYFRALAGMPADITFDQENAINAPQANSPKVGATVKKRTCAQAAAHMNAFSQFYFADLFSLNHTPLQGDRLCWSNAAWNGCYASNLTVGFFGPNAVDVYMADDDSTYDFSNNKSVGHRRWILYSRAIDMSTGDVPPGRYTDATGSYPILPANALYISSSPRPEEQSPKKFVSWPPAGFVPAPLFPVRWSLSYPGATFPTTAASISVTGPTGAVIPVTLLSTNAPELGDNSIVFQPTVTPTSGAEDLGYTVTITGMSGPGVPASYTWRSTFFNPTVLGTPISITGPAKPAASGSDYQCTAVPGSDGWDVQAGKLENAATFSENGDGATPQLTANTTGTYALLQGSASLNGLSFAPRSATKAMHLCFPLDESEPDYLPHNQSFQLTGEFLAGANSTLTFYEHFRWLFTVNRLSVEVSSDGGSRWAEVYGRNGAYTYIAPTTAVPNPTYNNTKWDTGWAARTVSLAAFDGQLIQIRFVLKHNNLSFDGPDIHHGCYIDDISVTNFRRFTPSPARFSNGPTFRFDSTLTGVPLVAGSSWLVRARPMIGGRLMGYTPPLTLVPQPPTGFEAAWPAFAGTPSGDADGDGIANFIEYAFALNPTVASASASLPQPELGADGLSLSFTPPAGLTDVNYTAECSSDLINWTPVSNSGTGSQRRFSVPVTPGQKCLIRLRVTQQGPAVTAP